MDLPSEKSHIHLMEMTYVFIMHVVWLLYIHLYCYIVIYLRNVSFEADLTALSESRFLHFSIPNEH